MQKIATAFALAIVAFACIAGPIVHAQGPAGARPDQAAIVDSFKQKIQDVLKDENSKRGPEHAEFVSRNVTPHRPLRLLLCLFRVKG